MTDSISIALPDDWHVHFRQDDVLPRMVQHTAQQFGRVLAMPNTKPPLTKLEDIKAYHAKVLDAVRDTPAAAYFRPYYALYLTPQTTPEEVEEVGRAVADDHLPVLGYKLYPQGGTTNAQDGISVQNIREMWPVLDIIRDWDLTLMVHGEIPGTDMFERERYFIQDILSEILDRYQNGLRITFEHITTQDAVQIVRQMPNVAATVTAHHLIHNRNAIFNDGAGLSPHHYCLPVLKTEEDRQVILNAAASHPRIFLGTDSAPHPRHLKESRCAPAGCFTAPVGIQLYAEAFDEINALSSLEEFASVRGAEWYGMGRRGGWKLRLDRKQPGEEAQGTYAEYPLNDAGDVVVSPWSDAADRWKVTRYVEETS